MASECDAGWEMVVNAVDGGWWWKQKQKGRWDGGRCDSWCGVPAAGGLNGWWWIFFGLGGCFFGGRTEKSYMSSYAKLN